ncbi:MAG: Gfo/Idh/MocA family oxidoreductase [Spirochaetales bacterium]|nr:Gfo/Idh/MocA family oxidoreductase [Spirochaetales bacterium]
MLQPIRTALASFGLSGRVFHAPFLINNPFYKLTTVLERSKNLSRAIIPEVKTVRNYAEILNDKDIELVIINTPDNLHFDMAKKALKAGKNVVVEKPFTKLYEEAEELVLLAEKLGLILTVYQNRRFDGDFMTLQKVLETNILGRIVEFESRMDRFTPEISSVWREKDTGRNGALFNLGSHMIDQAVFLFGKPDKITAFLMKQRSGTRIDDYCDIKLHYSGLSVNLKSSYLAADPGPRFRINGEKGSLVIYGFDRQEYDLKKSAGIPIIGKIPSEEIMKLVIIKKGRAVSECKVVKKGNYGSYYDLLFKAIREGKSPPVTSEQILLNMQMLEQAVKSDVSGRTISMEE